MNTKKEIIESSESENNRLIDTLNNLEAENNEIKNVIQKYKTEKVR